jgi:hypothetical protein
MTKTNGDPGFEVPPVNPFAALECGRLLGDSASGSRKLGMDQSTVQRNRRNENPKLHGRVGLGMSFLAEASVPRPDIWTCMHCNEHFDIATCSSSTVSSIMTSSSSEKLQTQLFINNEVNILHKKNQRKHC